MTAQRIALLSILTTCMFGFSIYMQNGQFILPFPLFRIGLLGIVIALFITEKKQLIRSDWFLFAWSFCLAISSHFLLEIVFNEATMLQYKSEIEQFSAITLLLFACFFFLWQLMQLTSFRSFEQWLIILGAGMFFIGMLANFMILLPFGLVSWYIGIKLSKNARPITEAVALLIQFILISVIVSIAYFGSDKVLAYL
jgi:hypothetical protein